MGPYCSMCGEDAFSPTGCEQCGVLLCDDCAQRDEGYCLACAVGDGAMCECRAFEEAA